MTESSLDSVDRRILDVLQQEGRISNVALSRKVHLSPTPCLERVKRLEKQGYIKGFYAHLDPNKLNSGLQVYVEVSLEKTTPDVFDNFSRAIKDLDEIVECHLVAGGFDYLLKLRVADMNAYRMFLGKELTTLPGVIQTHTYFVMEEVKSTHVVPVPKS